MNLPPAPAAYDRSNEQTARSALDAADRQNVKKDVAVDFILLANTSGVVGKLTIVGTTPTWTAL